mgnify:CR=1 FL=1
MIYIDIIEIYFLKNNVKIEYYNSNIKIDEYTTNSMVVLKRKMLEWYDCPNWCRNLAIYYSR